MIAHHRLHDREAQAGAMPLARVIGSEQARAFLRRQARAGVGDFEAHRTVVLRRAHGQRAAGGHGVERIENEIFERPAQQNRIGLRDGQDFRRGTAPA